MAQFKVGDIVEFGRASGEKTLGEIVKINPKKLKVQALGSRGQNGRVKAGSLWSVPPSLCTLVDGGPSALKVPEPEPEPALPTLSPGGQWFPHKGAKVQFKDRQGQLQTGVIERVNQKTCTVKTAGSKWRVSPNFLAPLGEPEGANVMVNVLTGLRTYVPEKFRGQEDNYMEMLVEF